MWGEGTRKLGNDYIKECDSVEVRKFGKLRKLRNYIQSFVYMYTTTLYIKMYKYYNTVYNVMSEENDRAHENFERDFPYRYKCVDCGDICRSRTLTDDAICPYCCGNMERIKEPHTIIVAIGDMN